MTGIKDQLGDTPYTSLEQVVPERHLAKCELCGHALDTRAENSYQRMSGWAPVNRSGGGVNALSLPKRENKWVHRHCIEREINGLTGQRSMFDIQDEPA